MRAVGLAVPQVPQPKAPGKRAWGRGRRWRRRSCPPPPLLHRSIANFSSFSIFFPISIAQLLAASAFPFPLHHNHRQYYSPKPR